jgi:hypothetical protein
MHDIKQDLVSDQLKQVVKDSPAPPNIHLPVPQNVRVPLPTVRFSGTYLAPDADTDPPVPAPIIEYDHEVDSASFHYPAYPIANSASDVYDGSHADIECPFAYHAFQEWLASADIQLYVQLTSTIVLHNDGGVNCFIFNDAQLFWILHPTYLSIWQVNGSHIYADGCGIVVIHPPGWSQLLALWPSYLYPDAPQKMFS